MWRVLHDFCRVCSMPTSHIQHEYGILGGSVRAFTVILYIGQEIEGTKRLKNQTSMIVL